MTAISTLPIADAPRHFLPRTDRPQEIFEAARDAMAVGHKVALVTLTQVNGRSSRDLGAQMIVLDDGRHCGYVAGGCVEGAIAAEAVEALVAGRGRTLKLGEGSPYFDIVLPCGGGITLDIRKLSDAAVIASTIDALANRKSVALRLEPSEVTSLLAGTQSTGWQGNAFVRAYKPRTRLLVLGRGIEAEALVRTAAQADIEILCATPDAVTAEVAQRYASHVYHLAVPDELDDHLVDGACAVAVVFHDLDWDVPLLKKVLPRAAFYIGALGSRTTHARRSAALAAAGVPPAEIAAIKAPIGAFGPTRDSDSLAISILADVMAANSVKS